MINIKFNFFLIFISLFCLSIEHTNSVGNKLLLGGLDFLVRKTLARHCNHNHVASNKAHYFYKTFFSTISKDNLQMEREEMTDKPIKKILKIVDIGKKDYKFDLKRGMHYYETKDNEALKNIKKLDVKDFGAFGAFVEFSRKNK